MRVLLSGFGVFADNQENPTELLMREVRAGRVSCPVGLDVRAVVLPVAFKEAYEDLASEIGDFKPNAIVSFGLASNRDRIECERVAINCRDSSIPDNVGYQPRDQEISAAGETGYFTTLPLRRLTETLTGNGIPSGISNSAGTYVCNSLMYETLRDVTIPSGFIHVPPLSRVPLSMLVRALECVLRVIATPL